MNPKVVPSLRKTTGNELPPEQIRFTELRVEPWPDGRRIRVHVDITPFQQNPNLEAMVTDSLSVERARALIVETAEHRIVFTMHIRGELDSKFTLTTSLEYPEIGIVDSRQLEFDTLPGGPKESFS